MQLQLYAHHQSFPSEQRNVRPGFALPPLTVMIMPWNKYTTVIAASTFLLVITGFLFTCKFMTYFSQQMRGSHASYMKLTYFWSFVQIIYFINHLEFFFQLLLTAILYKLHDPILPIKIFLMGIAISAIAIGMLCGCLRNKRKFPPLLSHSKEWSPCCCCTISCFERYKYWITMCNIYFFVYIICTSTISTGIYLFVNPILVLSIVAYVITSIFCAVALYSLPMSMDYLLQKLFKSGNFKDFEANCSSICNSVPYMLLFIVVDLLMLLYLIVLYQSEITNTSDIFQAGFSFLPSLIIGTLGYFTTKFTRRKLRNKVAKPDIELSVDTDSLKLAEEGRNLKENDAIIEEETVHLLKTVEDTEL